MFAPPETLPTFVKAVVDVNPITFLVSAMRGLMHSGVEIVDIAVMLAVIIAPIAVFAPLTIRAYRRHA